MKSLRENIPVAFNCIEIKDAIAVVPLMNSLIEAISNQQEFHMNSAALSPYETLNLYVVLRKLGFCSTITEEPEIVKEKLELD